MVKHWFEQDLDISKYDLNMIETWLTLDLNLIETWFEQELNMTQTWSAHDL